MPYQGHLPDGSSIQRHSAGTHYPFIVGKQEGQRRPWFVMDPSGTIIDRQVECAVAYENAEHLAKVRRESQAATLATPMAAKVFVAASGEHVLVPLNTGRPDCGEAGHADGACGTAQCLPSYRPPVYPDGWGVV